MKPVKREEPTTIEVKDTMIKVVDGMIEEKEEAITEVVEEAKEIIGLLIVETTIVEMEYYNNNNQRFGLGKSNDNIRRQGKFSGKCFNCGYFGHKILDLENKMVGVEIIKLILKIVLKIMILKLFFWHMVLIILIRRMHGF